MTRPTPTHRLRRLARPVRLLRGALVPAEPPAPHEHPRDHELLRENEELRARLGQAEERLTALEDRVRESDRLTAEVAELREGLHEARRLNLRVAELTDLVTELVLPLHDRQIDPAVLARLGADTL